MIPDFPWADVLPAEGGSYPSEQTFEVQALGPCGAPSRLECAVDACPVGGELVFVVVLRDLTPELEHAAETAHRERLMGIGRLAAEIGKDINTPLAYLIANLEFMWREMPDVTQMARTPSTDGEGQAVFARLAEFRDALAEARHGAARVREIAGSLKYLTHEDDARQELVNPARAFDAAIHLGWREIRSGTRLIREYGSVPFVAANEHLLVQVFLNLLLNAVRAVAAAPADSNEIRIRVAHEDDNVIIEVSDTGGGIASGDLPPAFPEPDTESGLSFAKEIIDGLHGEMIICAEAGKGSVLRVMLPAAM